MSRRLPELRVEPLSREIVDGVLAFGAGAPDGRVDLALVAYFEDERPLRGLAAFLDWRAGGKLSRLLRSGWCTGSAGEAVLLPGARGLPSERIVLLGLGPLARFGPSQARAAAASAVEVVRKLLPRDVLFAMPGLAEDRQVVEGVFAGIVLALGGTPRVPSDDEDDASEDGEGDPPADDADPDLARASDPEDSTRVGEARTPCRWWVVAEPRHVGRLRRVLEGPPRAT
jgi:hypothetical protein